eukprot:scaffold1070_cov245-Pinguiococcus_pyrenoidosus.AAC.16
MVRSSELYGNTYEAVQRMLRCVGLADASGECPDFQEKFLTAKHGAFTRPARINVSKLFHGDDLQRLRQYYDARNTNLSELLGGRPGPYEY